MKHSLLILSALLTITHFSFATQTYLYTFTSETFTGTITATEKQRLNLNGRTISLKCSSNSINCHYIPDRGLRITSSDLSTFFIYTITTDPTLTASITLDSKYPLSNKIAITKRNTGVLSPDLSAPAGISTISHTFTESNTEGPKITIQLSPTDTIYIRSIQFTFDITPTNPIINLSYQSSTIGTFPSDSLPTALPSITPADPRFSFAGWTTSSTLLTNSATAPADLSNTLTTAPSSDITLFPVFAHYRPNSPPESHTFTPESTSGTYLSQNISIPNDLLLTSLHFHIQGSSSTENTIIKMLSPRLNISNSIIYTSTQSDRFHELPINSFIPANTPIKLSAERLTNSLTVDSIVAITYPTPEPRFYSSIPPLTDSHNLTIDFPRTITPDDTLTAIDAMTYSMTIDDSRFYFISLPFSVPFNNITISPISGPHPRTYYYGYDVPNDQYLGDYVISDYDETTRSWRDLELSDLQSTGLLANHGYTIGLTKPNTQATITFRTSNATPDTPYTITTSQPETTLPTPLTNPSDTRNSGWHLIGNPYLTPLSPSSIYTSTNQHLNYVLIPNTTNTSYTILSPYSENPTTSIPPFTSFFIQSLTNNTIINPTNVSALPEDLSEATPWDTTQRPEQATPWDSGAVCHLRSISRPRLKREGPNRTESALGGPDAPKWHTAQRLEQATPWDTAQRPEQQYANNQSSIIYHFNIICEKDSITSTLTILSSETFTENYEPGADLKSLSPATDITHDGLAIYASNLTTGDTISITTPDNATLTLGRNILIPDHWSISIRDHNIIISDNTPTSTPDTPDNTPDNTPQDDPIQAIYTIDGRQLPLNTTLSPGIYILLHTSGRTSKTLIP